MCLILLHNDLTATASSTTLGIQSPTRYNMFIPFFLTHIIDAFLNTQYNASRTMLTSHIEYRIHGWHDSRPVAIFFFLTEVDGVALNVALK